MGADFSLSIFFFECKSECSSAEANISLEPRNKKHPFPVCLWASQDIQDWESKREENQDESVKCNEKKSLRDKESSVVWYAVNYVALFLKLDGEESLASVWKMASTNDFQDAAANR